MLSPLDDHPVHQTSEVIRHAATSDRNFYDRYYFNCHPCGDELFLIAGMGQYPNLGVADAFVTVRRGGVQHVVRASRELGADRSDTTVGPVRIEVLEGLQRLRVVLEPNDWDLEMDLTWDGAVPAHLEPRHYIRQFERVTFDSMRFAQTGRWTGRIRVGDETFDVTPDRWWGSRDRSWGVRPVGEAEPAGIRASQPPGTFFWNYAPMQFPDYAIVYIAQEERDGRRVLEDAVRIWPADAGRDPEPLGRPEHELEFAPGTREVKRATLRFAPRTGDPFAVAVDVLLPLYLALGTGYGLDADWRHGMYQGPLKVEGLTFDLPPPDAPARRFGVIDALARFEVDGQVGYGLFEHMVLGPHDQYGFTGWDDVAP